MIVGRRDFLRLLGIATAVASIDPTAVASVEGDQYINERLGLLMRKPQGWRFLSIVDYQEASKHQVLQVDDPEIIDILRAPDAMPVVLMTKFGADYDDLNPCIGLWDEPIEPGVAATEIEYHNAMLNALQRLVPQFERRISPTQMSLEDRTAATKSVWRYLYQHDSGREWFVQVRTVLAFRGDRTHTFHFMQGEVPPALAADELERAERSILYRGA